MEVQRPGRYFRLPRPAAVSTLAALTSPAPAAGGAETRRSCLVVPRGGEYAVVREARSDGAGPLGEGGDLRVSVPGVTQASPSGPS